MGRFYRTARPQNLEYMYELPEQYMLAAVQQASQDITENQAATFDLYGQLQLNALSPDKPRARQIVSGYEQAIDQISGELQKDPLAFRRRSGDIMRLGREIQKDFATGEAAAIEANYQADVAWQKAYDDLARKGKLQNANWIPKLRAANLSKFGGTNYDPVTGNYQSYSPDELAKYVDVSEELRKVAEKIKPRITATATGKSDGKFIYEWGGKKEVLTGSEIFDIIQNEFYSSPDMQDYIKQGSRIGALEGYFNVDERGNLTDVIAPFITDKDNNVIVNPKSATGPMFQSIMDTFKRDDVTAKHFRMKNVAKGGSGRKVNNSGYALDYFTGKISKPMIDYVDIDGKELPTVQVKNYRDSLTNQKLNSRMIKEASETLIGSLSTALSKSDNADQIIEQVSEAIKAGDEMKVKSVLGELKKNNIIVDGYDEIKAVYKLIDENTKEAFNAGVTDDLYSQAASFVSNDSTLFTADDIYRAPITQDAEVNLTGTQADYYSPNVEAGDEISDNERFNNVIQSIEKTITSFDDLPDNVIVWEQKDGVYTANQMPKAAFIDKYAREKKKEGKETDKPELVGKAGSTGSVLAGLDKKNETTGKAKVASIGKVSRIIDDVPYMNINDRKENLEMPFTIKIEDAIGGQDISVLIPREDKLISSEDLRYIDRKYSYKRDMDTRISKINTTLSGIKNLTGGQGLSIPDGQEYKLIEGVTYRPSFRGGKGVLIFDDGVKTAIIDVGTPQAEQLYRLAFEAESAE